MINKTIGQKYWLQDGTQKFILSDKEVLPENILYTPPPTEYHTCHNGSTWTPNLTKLQNAKLQEIERLYNSAKKVPVILFFEEQGKEFITDTFSSSNIDSVHAVTNTDRFTDLYVWSYTQVLRLSINTHPITEYIKEIQAKRRQNLRLMQLASIQILNTKDFSSLLNYDCNIFSKTHFMVNLNEDHWGAQIEQIIALNEINLDTDLLSI